jgi:hypothetical protein
VPGQRKQEAGMHEFRFRVFRKLVAVSGGPGAWRAFYLGADGKRRAADFIVPGELAADELAAWLADLFHEEATPGHDSVEPLP